MTESNSTLATAAQDSQAHTLKPVSGKTFEQLLGSAGCALILLDSKASTAVARLAVESAAIGTTSSQASRPPPNLFASALCPVKQSMTSTPLRSGPFD
jgi:hypothetical protein